MGPGGLVSSCCMRTPAAAVELSSPQGSTFYPGFFLTSENGMAVVVAWALSSLLLPDKRSPMKPVLKLSSLTKPT